MSSSNNATGPFIDGRSIPSESDGVLEVVNPSNGTRVFWLPTGSVGDVERAVASAKVSFGAGTWANLPPTRKKQILHCFADLVAREAPQLDILDATEMGKPVSERAFDAASAGSLIRYFAEAVDKVSGSVFQSDNAAFVAQRPQPRGVIAAIVPWNFPTYNVALKVAPALASGNSVVLKPSENATRSALRFAQLAVEAGVPPGVLNVVPGAGHIVGRGLGLHPDVDMLAFTGSTAVGGQMLQYAGQSNMKVVVAECGGKSPQIVFADNTDLQSVGNAIAAFILVNQGQICSVGSRVLVQRSIEKTLLEIITSRMKDIVMGSALDEATTFGPVASAKQCKRVMRYIEGAEAEGAELVLGGRRVMLSSGGFFVEPTVFGGVAPTACIAQEEIFGPVLSVIPFDDEAEAIRIANGTIYGLIAYVWTGDLGRAMRLSNQIRSSVVVNAARPRGEGAGHACSFEPHGQSGVGIEGGLAGLESYMRRQSVWLNYD